MTTFTYDANDNVLTETNALGKTTNTYDSNDHRTSITDPLGNVTRFTYNILGKVLTTTVAQRRPRLTAPSTLLATLRFQNKSLAHSTRISTLPG